MAITRCPHCGGETSTLAEACHHCGSALGPGGGAAKARAPRLAVAAPLALTLLAGLIALPPLGSAAARYRARVAEERIARDRAAAAERERLRAEERRLMTARADSVLRAMPASRLRRAAEADLRAALGVVSAWRADSVGRRWVAAAERELRRRERLRRRESATRPYRPPAITQSPRPTHERQDARTCCRVCTRGQPCGNTCIARNRTCRVGPGCAC